MKPLFVFVVALALSCAPLFSQFDIGTQTAVKTSALSQEEEELDPLRYFKPKYEEKFDANPQLVAEAIRKAIKDIDCVIVKDLEKPQKNGLLKILIKSDYCVISEGHDSTFDLVEKYSYKYPFIRGGSWLNLRLQYSFILKETKNEKTDMLLKTQMSGFEDNITNRVHFWKSNGLLEHAMLERIKKYVRDLKKEEEN